MTKPGLLILLVCSIATAAAQEETVPIKASPDLWLLRADLRQRFVAAATLDELLNAKQAVLCRSSLTANKKTSFIPAVGSLRAALEADYTARGVKQLTRDYAIVVRKSSITRIEYMELREIPIEFNLEPGDVIFLAEMW